MTLQYENYLAILRFLNKAENTMDRLEQLLQEHEQEILQELEKEDRMVQDGRG